MKAFEEIAHAVEQVEEGYGDALKTYADLKRLESFLGDALKQLQPSVVNELMNYPKGKAEIDGASFELRNSAGRWSFDDDTYSELKKQLKSREELHKEAYKMHLKGQVLVDADTGEQIAPAQYVEGKEVPFVKLAK